LSALTLLSGDAQTFVDKVWASRVHVHHAPADDLVGILSLDDVDHLLTSSGLRTPALRLAQDGTVLPASSYTRSAGIAGVAMSGLVDGRKVLGLFDAGATVVLQGLHRYWSPLTDLVRALELELGHPCQANAYLTPPGSQGFARHSDTHDVFVFQTAGSKVWEVYKGEVREVVMEPGTSMYLPTGTLHSARTQESVSLHVTLGINQLTWRGLLERALRSVLNEQEYAAHLPAGYLDHPDRLSGEIAERLPAIAAAIAALDPAALATAEAERFLTTRTSVLRGGLRDRVAVRSLSDATRVRRRPGAVCVLLPGGQRLRVLLGDRELRVPTRLLEPLEVIRASGELRPADLAPWLDEQSRLVLVRRLVVEGLLEVVG
jgi:bifunctional lysine-specific demethylase and histidyl-hydroxylase NO66